MLNLSVIIPIRYHDEYDLIERIRWRATLSEIDGLEVIIVDDGSAKEESAIIQEACVQASLKYIRIESENKEFSLSRARNVGVRAAKNEFVYFEDVDIRSYDGFYIDLFNEIENQLIDKNRLFINVPALYLSEYGTRLVTQSNVDNKTKSFLIEESYDPDSLYIQHHAPVTSLFCMRKSLYLKIGGFDESYEGWGFEDSDFAFKLLTMVPLEQPRNFSKLDTRMYTEQVDYNGWRSLFRIFGDILALKGIMVFHAFHVPAKNKSDTQRKKNRAIFIENSKKYIQDRYVHKPMLDDSKEHALFFSENPFSYNQDTIDAFGKVSLVNEKDFIHKSIMPYLDVNGIDVVVFNNPWGTDARKKIYDEVRNSSFPYIVVERGALPNSVYFDDTGFCAESEKYSRSLWDKEISHDNKKSVEDYKVSLLSSRNTLEIQSNSGDISKLKKEAKGKTIVFCALQSPSDTTTNFFCGEIGSYQLFLEQLKKLPSTLGDDVLVVYKNHPLANAKISIEGALNVDDYHIYDIIDASDYTVVLNSGVGVLSLLFEKNVITFGESFYTMPGLAIPAKSAVDVKNILKSNISFNEEDRLKFFSYLLNDFYSFASWKHGTRKHTDLAKMSIANDIVYSKVVIPNRKYEFIEKPQYFDLKKSYLFDRYRLSEYLVKKSAVTKLPAKQEKLKLEENPVTNNSPIPTSRSKESEETKRLRKKRKLKNKPFLYFYDALKNIVRDKQV